MADSNGKVANFHSINGRSPGPLAGHRRGLNPENGNRVEFPGHHVVKDFGALDRTLYAVQEFQCRKTDYLRNTSHFLFPDQSYLARMRTNIVRNGIAPVFR